MNREQFAYLVFGHLGVGFQGLSSQDSSTQIFNRAFEQCLKSVVYKSGTTEFVYPFTPALVYEASDEVNNPYTGRWVHSFPENLQNILTAENNPYSNDESRSRSYGTQHDVVFNPKDGLKYILSARKRPTLLGNFFVTNLAIWSAQAIETASIYTAWFICNSITKSNTLRTSLKKEFDSSLTEYKIYDASNVGGVQQRQFGGWTDPIDFESSIFQRNLFNGF